MHLYDSVTHSQADSMPRHRGRSVFPSEKGGEYQRLFFLWDAFAMVDEMDGKMMAVYPDPDMHGVVCRKFTGIVHKIEKSRLQQMFVSAHR